MFLIAKIFVLKLWAVKIAVTVITGVRIEGRKVLEGKMNLKVKNRERMRTKWKYSLGTKRRGIVTSRNCDGPDGTDCVSVFRFY